ncbi:MAG: T9SS type A sorting domain-containing protein [Ignavibacteria bacterium]|nr:T9SS type A sorting domain-containing protein [Ignavibacteria bacterium]
MRTLSSVAVLLFATATLLYGQTIQLPWHVVDRGGGKGTSGGVTLHASIGQTAIQAGASGGINLEPGYIPGIRTVAGTLDLANESGWKMVSVPVIVNDFRKNTLYPSATSNAFAYQGSYAQRDTLKIGAGYWLKFSSAGISYVTGAAIARETISVADKWNMIGTLTDPVLISDITPISPTTIVSNYFGYSNSSGYYTEDTLKPGKAYWIKVNTSGKLVLKTGLGFIAPKSSLAQSKSPDKSKYLAFEATAGHRANTLTVTDAKGREKTLYFSVASPEIDLNKYELPPSPPTEIFDVRYVTNRIMEVADKERSKEATLRISAGEYPLTVAWKSHDIAQGAVLIVDGKEIAMKEDGETRILHPTSHIKLRLLPAAGRELPKEFALYQNYPNPFNPSTVIRYQLPVSGYVTLKIYNVIGQEVATLVNEMQEAGYKSVDWNAIAFSGGVYYYRLVTGDFSSVKKLVVVK